MQVTITPSLAYGTVTAPPSKSIAHRALICGALSEGSVVHNVAYSQDIEATLRCLEAMGASVKRQGSDVTIGGLNPFAIPADTVLDCCESGSTLRFLLPLCLLADRPITLTGHRRLLERPLGVYEEICREQGLSFVRDNDFVTVCGPLQGGSFNVAGNVSSQFITGLLIASPLLNTDSQIRVTGTFESASYTDLTVVAQSAFGVDVRRENNTFSVSGGQTYAVADYTVEGDCSNAAFLDGFSLLGGSVKVLGLSPKTAQGDRVYQSFFTKLQSNHDKFDLSDCPDLGPVMFALSAALGGAIFTGTSRLRIKESDRVAAMVEELAKFGVSAAVRENSVEILRCELQTPTQLLCGHNDHRIVMALSLLCSVVGGTIDGAEAVAKSYPDYFEVIHSLGIEVNTGDIS